MKPRILAVDTTTEFGSLALVSGDEVIEEVLLHSPDGFAHILYEHLMRLLERQGRRPDEVDCYAAAAGPGSFTGVRVCLAAVKGLAAAMQRPMVAVSNLEAMAWFGVAALRAVVVDARRGEIYGAVYAADLTVIRPAVVMKFQDWLKTLPDGDLEFLSTNVAPFRSALAGTPWADKPVRDVARALAGAVGRIAARRFLAGLAQDPADVDACYVRRSDAELFWKE